MLLGVNGQYFLVGSSASRQLVQSGQQAVVAVAFVNTHYALGTLHVAAED